MREGQVPAGPRLAVLLGALSAFGPLSIDMYLPALPALRDDLGTGASEVQLMLTACLVGLAVGQVVAGPLSDAYGRRRPLLGGLALYVVASLACAAAPSVLALALARLAQGLAGAAGIVIGRAVVRDLRSGAAAARLFAALMLVNGLAPILAPIVGAQVLHATSWRGVFLVLAAIGALLLGAVAVGLGDTLPERRTGGLPDTLRTFRRLLGERAFVGLLLAGGLAMAAMFTYISASPFVLQEIHGVSPTVFSVIFGVNALGIVASGQLSARLVDRFGSGRLLAAGVAQTALGAGLLLVVVLAGLGLGGLLPALFLVVSSIGTVIPNATALALEDHPEVAGAASGLLGLASFAFGALAAPVAGVAGEGTAVPMAVLIGALGAGALVAFTALVRPALRRAGPVGAAS